MGYLKRIHLTEVKEVGVDGTHAGANPTIMYVNAVVTPDGIPWEPVPGPDPWDELVVSTPTKYSNLNDYTPGVEVFGHVAGFTGGSDQTIYQYRWQYQTEANPGSWVAAGGWTAYNNNPVLEVGYTIPAEAAGGKIRMQSRARDENDDPVTQVMSNAPAKTVGYPPLVVSATTVSGTPYAGETITCAVPTVTGGKAPYTYSYMWLDANAQSVVPASSSNSTTIGVYDVGKVMNCYVTVNSADGQTGNTTTTNGVGPIQQYTVGTISGQIDGIAYDPQETVDTVIQGSSSVLTVSASGNSPNLTYTWTVRQGDVRLTPSGAMCTIVHQSEPPQGEQVQVDVIDNYASDDNKSLRFAFFVSE